MPQTKVFMKNGEKQTSGLEVPRTGKEAIVKEKKQLPIG